jgi:hypothetical protein
MAQLYGKKTSDGLPRALECTDDGMLKVDTELTATIDPTGLATEATLADVLAKIIAAPSTEAKQNDIIAALGLIATEATAGDIKTATEALAALISAGALAVSLGELPDTAAGDLADINTAAASIDGKLPALVGGKIPVDASVSIDSVDIGDVDIKEFPAGNLGQQAKAASLSVAPATDITDATYIGDVKFGESLPAGSAIVGQVGIDQTTPGTTNLVNVNGGASQTADIKVTLDSESVAVTGPLTDAQLTTQALAKESTLGSIKTAAEALAVATPDTAAGDLASMSADLGTIQADIATVKADIALVKASVSNAGTAYCKTDTAASDAARRFETAEKKIMNASIQVTTNSQLFGQVDGILYQIDPGDTKSLGNIDISTLYFKNATAGQNGTVTILGVEE